MSKNECISEDVPKQVVDMLIAEFLGNVGGHDWTDNGNALHSMMELYGLSPDTDFNRPLGFVNGYREIERGIVYVKDGEARWVFHGFIRIDGANGYIVHEGRMYEKLKLALENAYFKEVMNKKAEMIGGKWGIRHTGSTDPERVLYRKTVTNRVTGESTSWIDKCVKCMQKSEDDVIRLDHIVMIEFLKA